jgi:hypothetical protein
MEVTSEILDRDQGADPKQLTSRERARVIGALKSSYLLNDWFDGTWRSLGALGQALMRARRTPCWVTRCRRWERMDAPWSTAVMAAAIASEARSRVDGSHKVHVVDVQERRFP